MEELLCWYQKLLERIKHAKTDEEIGSTIEEMEQLKKKVIKKKMYPMNTFDWMHGWIISLDCAVVGGGTYGKGMGC